MKRVWTGGCSILCDLRNQPSASLHSPESPRRRGKLRALSKMNTSLSYFLFRFSVRPQQFMLNLAQEISFTFVCFPARPAAYTINSTLWALQPSWILIFKTRFQTQKACFPLKNIPVTTDTEKPSVEVVNTIGLCEHILWASNLAQSWRIHQPGRRCGFDPWVQKIPWRRKW